MAAEVEPIMPPPTLRVVAPKPRMTVYYTLLIIALMAMITACIFLYMVIRTFGGFGVVQGSVAWLGPSGSFYHHREHGGHRGESAFSVNPVSSVVKS